MTDYLEEKQLSFQEVKSQIQNVYLAEETMKASKEFGENSVSELQNGLEISELSIQQGQTLENYKGIKRDSSLYQSKQLIKFLHFQNQSLEKLLVILLPKMETLLSSDLMM